MSHPKKRFFQVVEKDIRIRQAPEYPGKKVKKKTLVIGQEICVIKSQEFIYKSQALNFYLLNDNSGWVIDYSPGAKKKVLKEIFRTVGDKATADIVQVDEATADIVQVDKATADLVQEKLHHLCLRIQARVKRSERDKATAQQELSMAKSHHQEQHKLLREARIVDNSGCEIRGTNKSQCMTKNESLRSDLEKSSHYQALSHQKEQTILKLQGLLKANESAL